MTLLNDHVHNLIASDVIPHTANGHKMYPLDTYPSPLNSALGNAVLRERFESSTPAQAVADIAATDAKIFTVLDALKGYHQCPLNESGQLLTTFITPFGQYK